MKTPAHNFAVLRPPMSNFGRITSPMSEMVIDFEPLLRPETQLEATLIAEPAFQEGFNWGIPRFGHPEGKVGLHVREVLDNISQLNVDVVTYRQLRIVALSHDTFKNKEYKFGKRWRHHGLIARDFMEKHLNNPVLLDLIELHDEAFYIWRSQTIENRPEEAHIRLDNLLRRMDGHLDLFFLFYKCDTQTGDKIQAPLYWFEQLLQDLGT